jgi:hypothetical protein
MEVVGRSSREENINKVFKNSPPFLSYEDFYLGVAAIIVAVDF